MQLLVNGGVYYLVDGHKPLGFAGMQPIKAVVAHSPSLDAYKDFMKQYGVHKIPWYMPPLEQGEVPIFPHVPKEMVSIGPCSLAGCDAKNLAVIFMHRYYCAGTRTLRCIWRLCTGNI